MSKPAISVVLLSHNKGEYVLEAIESVLHQTFKNWELWIAENSTDETTRDTISRSGLASDPRIHCEIIDIDPEIRESKYVEAWLANQFYPKVNGEFIIHLSDDDLLKPECLERCVDFLTNREICYFTLEIFSVEGPRKPPCTVSEFMVANQIPCAIKDHVDGGQIAFRASCLNKLSQPYFPETYSPEAGSCDGVFLEKLAQHFTFYPLNECLAVHRRTPESLWTRYDPQSRSVIIESLPPERVLQTSDEKFIYLRDGRGNVIHKMPVMNT